MFTSKVYLAYFTDNFAPPDPSWKMPTGKLFLLVNVSVLDTRPVNLCSGIASSLHTIPVSLTAPNVFSC